MEKILHKLDPGRLASMELLFKQAQEALLKHDKKIDELFRDVEQHENRLRRLTAHMAGRQVPGFVSGDIREYMANKADQIGDMEGRILAERLAIQDINTNIQSLKGEREYFQERFTQTQLLLDSCREFAKENLL